MPVEYFENGGVTYGYDTDIPGNAELMAAAVAAGWPNVTATFPPPATAAANIYIKPASFLARFTPGELGALATSDPTWGTVFVASVIEAGGQVDVTNVALVADLNAAVTAGTLTAARVTQILNLSVASP